MTDHFQIVSKEQLLLMLQNLILNFLILLILRGCTDNAKNQMKSNNK
jgi:hypothetical protein